MTVKRMGALLLAAALSAALTSCGKPAEDPGSGSGGEIASQEPSVSVIAPIEPEPEPVYPYHNPLTGEGLEEDISGQRPFAVMLNNLSKALPQLGVSQADVIYEIVAEGGITRMLAVFQDIEGVGDLGSVRSARDYYVSLACGHDAIYVHAGGSPQAYDALQGWGMSYIDFVNGPYGDMCWRDPGRRKTAGLAINVYEYLNREALEVAPGSDGLLFFPYMLGERAPLWNSYSRGMFIGMSLNTERKHFVRSVFEGTAFALRHVMETIKEAGGQAECLRITGGGSKSRTWSQIKASMLHMPIYILDERSGDVPFGDVLIAGTAVGVFSDLTQTIKELIPVKEVIEPVPEWEAVYDKLYPYYLDMYQHLDADLRSFRTTVDNI